MLNNLILKRRDPECKRPRQSFCKISIKFGSLKRKIKFSQIIFSDEPPVILPHRDGDNHEALPTVYTRLSTTTASL